MAKFLKNEITPNITGKKTFSGNVKRGINADLSYSQVQIINGYIFKDFSC